MDDGMDTGGFDSSSTSGSDDGETVDITESNEEVEVSSGEIEISTTVEVESNIGKNETSVSVTDHSSASVNISDAPEHASWDVEGVGGAKGLEGMIDNLNSTINGIKENGEVTEAEKNEAIRTSVNDTIKNIGMSDMSPEEKVEAMQAVLNNLPEGAEKNISVPGNVGFLDSEMPFDAKGNPVYAFEGNMGFEGKPESCSLSTGQVVDRYGMETGSFVCEVKNGVKQSYDSRSIPYAENPGMYHQYEVTRDMDDFKSRIDNLTVEEIEQIEIQRDLEKPEAERRSPEQIKEDAADKHAFIMYDVEKTSMQMQDAASKNGWENDYKEAELQPMKGKIAECFSYVDENGVEHKRGGGEQICLPASIDTLTYLGYMKEKE